MYPSQKAYVDTQQCNLRKIERSCCGKAEGVFSQHNFDVAPQTFLVSFVKMPYTHL